MSDTLEEFNRAYSEKEQWAREMGIYGFAEKLERERDEARDTVEQLTKHGLDLMDANRMLKRELKRLKGNTK